MRLGILADIHANREALEAVLIDGANAVDQWWFIGDVLGRGPSPVETLELLRQHVSTRCWLVGNHDAYVVELLPSGGASEMEQRIWEDHRSQLKDHRPGGNAPDLWVWCRRTWRMKRAEPRLISMRGADCWLVHAALGDRRLNVGDVSKYSYIFPWSDMESRVIREQQIERLRGLRQGDRTAVLIHGHTHIPCLVARPWGIDREVLLPIQYTQPQRLDQFDTVLLNPGSVGQPRNGDPRAAYGILNTDASTFEFRRVDYDSEPVRLAMAARNYDIALIHLLEGSHDHNPLKGRNATWLEWERIYRAQSWGWEPAGTSYR